MGTNYYLFRKIAFNEDKQYPPSLGCTDKEELVELTNGWVLHNTYYPNKEELNKHYYQKIHIGKSSYGWRFLLCIYPTENPLYKDDKIYHQYYLEKEISSLGDWIVLFNNPNNYIQDECGEKISTEEMIEIITKRKPSSNLKEGWQFLDNGKNNEYRAINGLRVHDFSRRPYFENNYVVIMPPDCTYDLILSGNDAGSGAIFS